MKKIFVVIFCVLLLSVVGCQKDNTEDVNNKLDSLGKDIDESQRRIECLNIIDDKADANGNINISDVPYRCRDVLNEVLK